MVAKTRNKRRMMDPEVLIMKMTRTPNWRRMKKEKRMMKIQKKRVHLKNQPRKNSRKLSKRPLILRRKPRNFKPKLRKLKRKLKKLEPMQRSSSKHQAKVAMKTVMKNLEYHQRRFQEKLIKEVPKDQLVFL